MKSIGDKTHSVLFKFTIFVVVFILVIGNCSHGANADPTRIIHEGDLTISGNEVFLIEGVTYYQTGNIFVHDNAKVVIRNSTVFFNQRFSGELGVRFSGNSSLEMQDSSIDSNYYGLHIDFCENATGLVERSFIHNITTVGDSANIEVIDASMHLLFIQQGTDGNSTEFAAVTSTNSSIFGLFLLPLSSAVIEVESIKPGFFNDWSLQRDSTVQNFPAELRLINTSVNKWSFCVSGFATVTCDNCEIHEFFGYDQSNVLIRNSIVSQVTLSFQSGQKIELNHFKKGFIPYLEIQDIIFNQKFVIENSEISSGWKICSKATQLVITDSDIAFLILGRERDPYSQEVVIRDSYVEGIWLSAGSGVVTFDNVTVATVFNPMNAAYYLQGSVTFINDTTNNRFCLWSSSTINREFLVKVIDSRGSPLSGVDLELHSPQGELIWSSTTNDEGEARFEIAFDDSNCEDKWVLVAISDHQKIRKVNFLTSTPIVLHFPAGKSQPSSQLEEINKQMLPLANYHISKAKILSIQAQDLLSEAEEKKFDTSECQELIKMAEELLAKAQDYFEGGNYIAANVYALKAIEAYGEAIELLERLLS